MYKKCVLGWLLMQFVLLLGVHAGGVFERTRDLNLDKNRNNHTTRNSKFLLLRTHKASTTPNPRGLEIEPLHICFRATDGWSHGSTQVPCSCIVFRNRFLRGSNDRLIRSRHWKIQCCLQLNEGTMHVALPHI